MVRWQVMFVRCESVKIGKFTDGVEDEKCDLVGLPNAGVDMTFVSTGSYYSSTAVGGSIYPVAFEFPQFWGEGVTKGEMPGANGCLSACSILNFGIQAVNWAMLRNVVRCQWRTCRRAAYAGTWCCNLYKVHPIALRLGSVLAFWVGTCGEDARIFFFTI